MTGIVTPETSSKMSKRMKGIKIDAPKKLNSGDKKWRDPQYLDTWINAIQRWLNMKGISLESKEAWDFIGFKLQGSVLTTYNHHLIKEKNKASFFNFMLVLREFLIPSTSKDLLLKEWEAASPHKDGRHMGIKTFANWLEELQIKLIDKDGNQCISEEVNAGNSSTTYQITWKPPWLHKYLIHGLLTTLSRKRNHMRLHENMSVFQLHPNLLDSQLLLQFRTLVAITAGLGRPPTRKQVLILEGPLLRKQQAPMIRTGKWLTRR